MFAALAACVIWSCLLFARGGFWRARERDDAPAAAPAASEEWPAVVAIVPARDEAPLVAETLGSLLR
ncbi:MAG: glycosyl transferase family 2, partial [Betaproteobacteria bacterium]|nr:glycosyl transferase family 2 [Betaproteobacteria bacterium]